MEVVLSLSSVGVEAIFRAIKHQIRYVFVYKTNIEEFEEKIRMLIEKRGVVQRQLDAAESSAEKIEIDVQYWCARVDEVISEEAKKMKDLEDKAKTKCFIGLCPNIKSRYQLSRRAEEGVIAILELLERGRFDRVAYAPKLIVDPSDRIVAFESRQNVLDHIMDALKDANISTIGVCGMAGVGKTILVKEVARQVSKVKLFDLVVMVNVSQRPDIDKIQDEVADFLGLFLVERSMQGKARRLYQRLKMEKKILVVLDDIWGRVDLNYVGIPFGDQHNGCKILLTTRNQDVLHEMEAQRIIQVGVLNRKESWDLFKKIAGDRVESPELISTAIKIVEECAGLPLAITTVARALRNKDLLQWRDALKRLATPSSRNIIDRNLYSAIETSYYHLEGEELKQTFLLCSLLGHDASIECLLRYTMGLGLFYGVSTVEETRYRLFALISGLKASCLLLDSNTYEHVNMHDLVRDVALLIASHHNWVFSLEQDTETMRECKGISLRLATIRELPDELKCPQLTFFSVGSRDSSMTMPPNFFNETKDLKVLDLTKMQMSPLPLSIGLLTDLQTLSLEQCVLGDIVIVGELRNLKVLSLSRSDIKMLPKEIGRLTCLSLLDLSHCTKLKIISPGVLANLSRLEELYMGNSFAQWEADQGYANQGSNASLDELQALSRLTALDVHVLDAKIMPRALFFEKLRRYKIFVGDVWDWLEKNEYSRVLKLKINTSIDQLDRGMKRLLEKTEALHLKDLEGVKIVLNEVGNRRGFLQLKNLHIQDASEMQHIIKGDDAVDEIEFLQLESLTLEGLPQLISFCSTNKRGSTSIFQQFPLFNEQVVFPCLEKLRLVSVNVERIWQNQLPNISCCTWNLKSLIIEDCGNLKRLLSSSTVRSLMHLEYLEIIECRCLEEIIFMEDSTIEESNAIISFPQLSSLKIRDLQNLIGFCSGNHCSIEFPSLMLLEIEHCPRLKGFMYKSAKEENQRFSEQALFDEKVAFPSLEKVTISHLRNLKIIWKHSQLSQDSFCKLKRMEVEGCDELLTIFPSNMLGIFQGLQTLKVSNCGSLEEVFELGRPNTEIRPLSATQLKELYIFHLPKLKCIWSKDPQGAFSFGNLNVVHVWDCCSLKDVFPASIAKDLPQLEDLRIDSCGVEEIVSKMEGSEIVTTFEFDQMSSLVLRNLPKLKCFYPGTHTITWPRLKRLVTPLIQQPAFWNEKVIPKLEELSLNSDDIAMMRRNQSSANFFHKIKVLKVLYYPNEAAIFPFSFLQRFDNMEKLEVICCKFKELFPNEGHVEETSTQTLQKIKFLKVSDFHDLRHIWKQRSRLNEILPNLETLEVRNCGGLISFGPSLASFQSITTLEVWECHRIISIITSSAGRDLVHLTKLRIRECSMVTEIFANAGEEATCEVVFSNLKYLELHWLPSLTSFYSGHGTFNFPSLEEVIVRQCPRMKIFSLGVSTTRKLQRVQLTEEDDQGCWVDDLNTTIQYLYEQKVGYHGLEYLELSRFPELMETWNKNSQRIIDFKRLKNVEIYNCSSLRYMFNPSMVVDLVHLENLEICDCKLLEEVIITTGTLQEERLSKMFPRMVSLRLIALPKLTRFCSGHYFEFPILKGLWIQNCPLLGTFISSFETRAEKRALFDEKVAFPSLEKLAITNMENFKRMSSGQLSEDSFCRLKVLKLIGLPKQSTSLPPCSSQLISNLQELVVGNANYLNELFPCEGADAEIKHGWSLPQFGELRLFKLDRLTHLWKEGFQPGQLFENLKTLKVSECSALTNLVPSSVSFKNLATLEISQCHGFLKLITPSTAKSMAQLQTLKISHCKRIQEIVASSVGGVKSVIVFKELKYLRLQCLPSLKSFCSTGYTFTFPSLDELIVGDCPKLEVFSTEDLSAPLLRKVCLTEEQDNWHWAGDLNTTIKVLSEEKSQNHHLQELESLKWSLSKLWEPRTSENVE